MNTSPPKDAPPPLRIRLAEPQDFEPLQQMLELYQYELSDIWPQDLDSTGRFGYDLSTYRKAERFFAYVALTPECGYVGFALVAPAAVTRRSGAWMDQFFILERHRRAGAGRALARYVLERHPGAWEIGQMYANLAAQAFWRSVVAEVTGGEYVEVEVTEGWWTGVVQQFTVQVTD
jgi:predicted acetyltransferase